LNAAKSRPTINRSNDGSLCADVALNDLKRAGLPGGAIPKDGPSAGVTMAIALASLYTKAVARSDTAMTCEITLTGLVLPIGGVKEKVLAARRAGIRCVILPKENEKDLRELPDNVRAEMGFIFVERVEDALSAAIPGLAERMKEPKAA
jgi:ATP-dependent Lon protease